MRSSVQTTAFGQLPVGAHFFDPGCKAELEKVSTEEAKFVSGHIYFLGHRAHFVQDEQVQLVN